ncbi:MAG: hypothetical protein ABSG84_18300 [Acidobacteriaceae bacterium]
MRTLAIAALLLFSVGFADGQKTIRQVDFKNFNYPRTGPLLAHDRLMWLDRSATSQIRLHGGKDSTGFTLASVKYADATGDAKEEAIVVLHYDTGGTQQTDYIYIYSLESGRPKLLAYCYTGDRAHSGLYKVFGQSGKLVVDLFDPDKASGDCCSSGFIQTTYEWRGGRFMRVGPRQFGTPEPQNYTIFGQRITNTAP